MVSTKRTLPPLRPATGRVPHQVLQIAHRGGGLGAEDYEPAHLAHVAALGTPLVEVDLRTTADGHLVVHHDPEVATDAGAVAISAASMRELAGPTADRVHPAASVLRAARSADLGVYLDIKAVPDSALPQLVRLLANTDLTDRCIFASSDAATVARCATAAPHTPRAVLFRPAHTDPIKLAETARADFVHPCWEHETRPDRLVAGPWLERVRRHGLGVVCWHEERPEILSGLLTLGVDAICTDDPALLAGLAAGTGG